MHASDGEDNVGFSNEVVLISKAAGVRKGNFWLLDSGATRHVTNRRDWLHDYEPMSEPVKVKIGDSRIIYGYGCGKATLVIDGEARTFTDVLYVPRMFVSVLSVSKLDEKGVHVEFGGGKAVIKKDGAVLATGELWHGVYRLEGRMVKAEQGGKGELLSTPSWQRLPSNSGIGG